MKIKEMSYGRLISDDFTKSNKKFGVTVELSKTDDPHKVFEELKSIVDKTIEKDVLPDDVPF